jgi:hypothetical protein
LHYSARWEWNDVKNVLLQIVSKGGRYVTQLTVIFAYKCINLVSIGRRKTGCWSFTQCDWTVTPIIAVDWHRMLCSIETIITTCNARSWFEISIFLLFDLQLNFLELHLWTGPKNEIKIWQLHKIHIIQAIKICCRMIDDWLQLMKW